MFNGNLYYYIWKDLSNIIPNVNVDNGYVEFIFDVEETSSMRAHKVKFVVFNNKLVSFEKYFYNQNDLKYIEKTILEYVDVEVNIPFLLIESEDGAVSF